MAIEELTCRELVEVITDYLEGRLSPEERVRFELHVVTCPGCEAYLDQMRKTMAIVGTLREEYVPAPGRERLLAAFRTWKRE